MKYYIANFSQLGQLNKNCIPISTCAVDPYFFHQKALSKKYYLTEGFYLNDNDVLLGIREPFLSPSRFNSNVVCEKHCPYKESVPDCPFLANYKEYLSKLDFDHLLAEFERVSEEVRKVNNFKGEAAIVLLVYEAENNPCSERKPLIEAFKQHNIELKNWEHSELEIAIFKI